MGILVCVRERGGGEGRENLCVGAQCMQRQGQPWLSFSRDHHLVFLRQGLSLS